MDNQPTQPKKVIKSIYFYLVSFVALMMVVFSTADIINIALKTWVFTKADNERYYSPPCEPPVYPIERGAKVPAPVFDKAACEKQTEENKKNEEANRVARKQQSVVRDLSMILVGIPLFLMHWRIVRRKDENL